MVGRYRHIEGGLYHVLGLARDSETEEEVVVYCPAGEPESVWVRPLAKFAREFEREGVLPPFAPLGSLDRDTTEAA